MLFYYFKQVFIQWRKFFQHKVWSHHYWYVIFYLQTQKSKVNAYEKIYNDHGFIFFKITALIITIFRILQRFTIVTTMFSKIGIDWNNEDEDNIENQYQYQLGPIFEHLFPLNLIKCKFMLIWILQFNVIMCIYTDFDSTSYINPTFVRYKF